jgi:hypothetical protein
MFYISLHVCEAIHGTEPITHMRLFSMYEADHPRHKTSIFPAMN